MNGFFYGTIWDFLMVLGVFTGLSALAVLMFVCLCYLANLLFTRKR